ncbi:heme-degrading domain-containing protein [Pseudomonas sp. dw_358]|uniref:heme-degrading domain-containing protein n=1 Tax=Pseudomonas sp. dw_358 TaxID=2720083 RepID=UPI001BD5F634|nr:heme-degrading domain-containing protein [Pseudomonas sp. dw_358]
MNHTRQQDLQRIAHQEALLQFPAFDKRTAWELGVRLKDACQAAGVATTIEVRLGRATVFLYAMPGTAPNNADWARRKRNVVEMMDRSSYAVGLLGEEEGVSMEVAMGLPLGDYASHGGAFPLRVKGTGCVGVATLSGLPSREDHSLVVRVLADMCGVAVAEVALDL